MTMNTWLASIALLVVVFVLVSGLSRRIVRATGRTRSLSGTGTMLSAALTATVVLVECDLSGLPLPWLLLVVGASGGAIGLLAQLFAGRRAA